MVRWRGLPTPNRALTTLDTVAVSQTRRARAARKRKRRVDAADNDLTSGQWEAILEAWGGCAYCGAQASADASLQRDCVLPISRGGRYTAENVVPACRSCNASKCNEEVTHWLRRKRLDEAAFLVRFYEINALLAARL
jgi:5-methylcytosine-specific restriction endonuclease McrA